MSLKNINRIHHIYGIICGAVAVIAGLCFVISARQIYEAGLAQNTQPYTYETIGAAFARISIPVYLCLALVIGGIVLNIILPQPKKKLPAEKNLPLILARLQAKTDLAQCDSQLRSDIVKQQNGRSLRRIICIGLFALSAILFATYACNGKNWAEISIPGGINQSMIKAVFALVLCLLPTACFGIYTAYACKRSLSKEIELMRQANAAAPLSDPRAIPCKNRERAIVIARYAILTFAVCILVYGFFAGGTADVLAKAAAICTECVGLG